MILQSFEFFSRCHSENPESVQLPYQAATAVMENQHCSAANSRTTQSGVSRVAASTSTVSTDTITSSGTFDNIMSSAGVNMDNISSLPNDSIITNCFATANESGSRTQKHSKHSKSRKKI